MNNFKKQQEIKADKDTKWIVLTLIGFTIILFGFMIKYGFQ